MVTPPHYTRREYKQRHHTLTGVILFYKQTYHTYEHRLYLVECTQGFIVSSGQAIRTTSGNFALTYRTTYIKRCLISQATYPLVNKEQPLTVDTTPFILFARIISTPHTLSNRLTPVPFILSWLDRISLNRTPGPFLPLFAHSDGGPQRRQWQQTRFFDNNS